MIARCLGDMAHLYKTLGREEEAQPLFLQSLQMMQRVLPKGDSAHARELRKEAEDDIARCLKNVSKLYYATHCTPPGRVNEAESAQESAESAFRHEEAGRFDVATSLFHQADQMICA